MVPKIQFKIIILDICQRHHPHHCHGILFFRHTNNEEEYAFSKEMKHIHTNWQGPRIYSEPEQMAKYISSIISEDRKILIDDAAAYPIVVHIGSLDHIVMPQQKTFLTIVENPAQFVKYMLIAKKVNPTQNLTVLNEYNLKKYIMDKGVHALLMMESENWAVYQVSK